MLKQRKNKNKNKSKHYKSNIQSFKKMTKNNASFAEIACLTLL